MKKFRDKLRNKSGFTLVELIVVIVIILILAAALIPNVMRYIDEARKASFKADASSYLVEVQGATAECYGMYDTDLTADAINGTGLAITTGAGVTYNHPLSALDTFEADEIYVEVTPDTSGDPVSISHVNTFSGVDASSSRAANNLEAVISEGAVVEFAFANHEHYITWTQADGWSEVTTVS